MLEPKIYVACLAAYNSGYLHGKWIDATQGVDFLWDEVNKMLAESPIPNAEEWAIHDFEEFGSLRIEEWTSFETISQLASFVVEHGELSTEVLSHACGDLDDALRLLDECYHGEFKSEEDFVYYWVHEVNCQEIPEFLQYYIDYEKMANDWFTNDFFSIELNHKIYVFSNL